jgi:hypothetical protein
MANKIIVGCKLPHGLTVSVKGTRITFLGANKSVILASTSEDGVGITRDVDSDLFAAFLTEYAESDFVKKGFIFQIKSESAIAGEVKDRKTLKTGMEQIVPATGEAKDGKVTTDKE